MKSTTVVCTLFALVLTACGGSGGDSSSGGGSGGNGASSGNGNSGSGTPTPSNPVTTGYIDFSYLQNVNGIPASTASSIVDKGQNNANALTFFNGSATITTTSAGYTWGSPLTAGIAIATAANNSNVPSVIELCENVPGQSSTKSIDVLIQGKATAITSAIGLANQTFGTYLEDCGTSPSDWGGTSLVFDASGNATSGTMTLTAAQITSMLTGTPNTSIVNGGFATFNAYSYQTAYGTTGYVIVEHLAGTATNPTKGVISVWSK
jgi:hypothetical protein